MRFRNTLLALVVLGGLIAFVYYHEYKGEQAREESEQAKNSLVTIDREAVESLEIARPGAEPVKLLKDAAGWSLKGPIETKADPEKVDSLLSALTYLRIERTLTDATAEEKK